MIDKFAILPTAKVRDALRQLEDTSNRTLFVVGKDCELYGSLTDGDVRRWILSGGDLDGAVEVVCNRDPYAVSPGYDVNVVRQEMLRRNISCIPIVDVKRRVVDVIVWDRIFGEQRAETVATPVDVPVVIMAGGKGTRLAPFTSVLPKPLIPLGDKTVIELIVDAFREFGIGRFYLSVNYKSKIIKSYFDELDPPYQVQFISEDMPLGTAGGLHALAGKIFTDLIVTNCDIIVRANYYDLVKHHREQGNDITLVVSLKRYSIPYGVCEIENGGHLKAIREKPEHDFLISTGLYVLRPEVLEKIPKGRFFDITDLIESVRAAGRPVGVFPISDKAWIDTGEWAQYRSAVAQLTADRRQNPR